MSGMTNQQRAAIIEVKQQIAEVERMGESKYDADWNGQKGVLLSCEEAECLLSLIPQAREIVP